MRLLITGIDGFTGVHLARAAQKQYDVFGLQGDLQDAQSVRTQIHAIAPTHVLHLAGISHAANAQELNYYSVNLVGSLNLVKALSELTVVPQKIILASSAHIYGNNPHSPIQETESPEPISHYAMSKLAMEYLSKPYDKHLPIAIARPFNYTGIGHGSNFVIPKIVEHFVQKADSIELGNLAVYREYNDVRDVCEVYLKLLAHAVPGQTYNLASGRSYCLQEAIDALEKISGHHLAVKVNPQFVRANEIVSLSGSAQKLESCIGPISWRPFDETLAWMYQGG